MKFNTTGVVLTAALVSSTIALPVGVQADWSGDIEGGTVIQGDSKGSLLRFKMSNRERPLNQQIYADWIRGDSGADTYKIGYEPQYWMSDKTYVFGDASLLTSKDTNIDQERNLFAGLGIQLLNSRTQNLYAEVGAGQTSTRFDEVSNGSRTQDTNTTIARLGASQVLTDFLKFELDGSFSTSDESDVTVAEAGLALRMAGGAIKYTYRLQSEDFDNEGVEDTDTTDSFVSYTYGF